MYRHLEVFRESLLISTRNVRDEYFNFRMAEVTEPRHLERVYCYELYHQLRNVLPSDFPFLVQNEIDKSNHPVIDGKPKPDFLFHIPERMDNESNLVIIEVKRESQTIAAIAQDLEKLIEFTNDYHYHMGIALIFGNISELKKSNIILKYKQVCEGHFDKVKLYFHNEVGTPSYEFSSI